MTTAPKAFLPELVERVRQGLGDKEPPGSPVAEASDEDVGSGSDELESGLRAALLARRAGLGDPLAARAAKKDLSPLPRAPRSAPPPSQQPKPLLVGAERAALLAACRE
jgi:hypothetical protein